MVDFETRNQKTKKQKQKTRNKTKQNKTNKQKQTKNKTKQTKQTGKQKQTDRKVATLFIFCAHECIRSNYQRSNTQGQRHAKDSARLFLSHSRPQQQARAAAGKSFCAFVRRLSAQHPLCVVEGACMVWLSFSSSHPAFFFFFNDLY